MEFKIDCPDCGHSHCVHDVKRPGYARCPNCDSTTHHFIGVVEETILIGPSYDVRVRDPNLSKTQGRKRGIDIRSGASWCHDRDKFVELYRKVDRKTDRYRELVIDRETGEVLHHCDQPLSEHRKQPTGKRTG